MTNGNYLWTSECVSAGHPDKVADQISDAVLDAYLKEDANSKVACETLITPGLIVVAGEVKSNLIRLDVDSLARQVVSDAGYNSTNGFDSDSCRVINAIGNQSNQINKAVDKGGGDIGAGDQGMMFGYATNETDSFMPTSIEIARQITNFFDLSRREMSNSTLGPDFKTQVTLECTEDNRPLRVSDVVVSSQHKAGYQLIEISSLLQAILRNCIADMPNKLADLFSADTRYLLNPAGLWTLGGPAADTGLTGRKIVVDNYGSDCQIGGGAFSGKDPSKVDRSAAYIARYIAKNIVAAGVADKAKIQLSYAIGVSEAVSFRVDTMGTSKVGFADFEIAQMIEEVFDTTPANIIDKLQLRNPIYRHTAANGHFGISPYRRDGI
jgi:S-adenosylmethionine synthetase